MIIHGDSNLELDKMEENSIDTVITDPPYGLKFMGKKWDYDIPKKEFWSKVLRVCKPGAIMLVFGGTRTFHRLAVEIEDAGFEIRDTIAWIQGQGFPKSYDIAWNLHLQALRYFGDLIPIDEETEQKTEYGMRFVQSTYLSQKVYACYQCGQILQPCMSEQEISKHKETWFKAAIFWPKQSIVERRDNVQKTQGELQRCEVCKMSHGVFADGAKGWLYNGTSFGDGKTSWKIANENGSDSSYRSQSIEQSDKQFDAILIECTAQAFRGYGTALKPAIEFICVAMKPIDDTFAQNALEYGVAGLNIDGARIGTNTRTNKGRANIEDNRIGAIKGYTQGTETIEHNYGRFPANIILDEISAEMLDEQSGFSKSTKNKKSDNRKTEFYSAGGEKTGGVSGEHNPENSYNDSGGASRFFYVAKASKKERNQGLEHLQDKIGGGLKGTENQSMLTGSGNVRNNVMKNNHPTVKPLALLEYLCTLTKTPFGGIVLDPFMGSGTTGIAAHNTDREFIGIEIDEEYFEIAKARIDGGIN